MTHRICKGEGCEAVLGNWRPEPYCDTCRPADYWQISPESRTGFEAPNTKEHGVCVPNLYEIRVGLGYESAASFARHIGIGRNTYGKWERGEPMSRKNLGILCRELDLTEEELTREL